MRQFDQSVQSSENWGMTERIGPVEAKQRMDERGYLYVDVRSIPEFEAGHPTGAYNLPLLFQGDGGLVPNESFEAEFERAFPDKDAPMVIGCRSGRRSLIAADRLKERGYTGLVDLRSGFSGVRDAFGQVLEIGWEGAGLPVATEPEPGRSYEALRGRPRTE